LYSHPRESSFKLNIGINLNYHLYDHTKKVRTTTKTNVAIIINPPNTDNDDDEDNFERLDDIGIL
jgi:hypothetical protein